MVLFDKKRNMVIKTSILTNMPNIYYRSRKKNGTYTLYLKNKSEQKYINSTDLELLIDKCVEDYGYILETDLVKATTEDFPYVVIDEVSEDIVLCDDGKFRLYGYRDEKPFILFDGSSELLKTKLWNKNLANVKNVCTTRKGVLYKGEFFGDWKSFCKYVAISPITLGDRIRNGKTLEEAVDVKVKVQKGIEYEGKTYQSRSAIASAFGISQSLLNLRLNSGMSIKEAINTPVRERLEYFLDGRYVEYSEGNEYSKEELRKEFGIGEVNPKLNMEFLDLTIASPIGVETVFIRQTTGTEVGRVIQCILPHERGFEPSVEIRKHYITKQFEQRLPFQILSTKTITTKKMLSNGYPANNLISKVYLELILKEIENTIEYQTMARLTEEQYDFVNWAMQITKTVDERIRQFDNLCYTKEELKDMTDISSNMIDKVEYVYMIEFDGIYNRLVKAERLQKILADGSLLGQKEEIELKETSTGLEVKDTDIERLEQSYSALNINALPLYH